ncbi:hypothetical protein ACS0TY_009033 [Phlomoides rotata]
MISLFHVRCLTILARSGHPVRKSKSCGYLDRSWKASFIHRTVNSGLLLSRFYSSKDSGGGSSRKRKTVPKAVMKDDKESFFVVRKGDLVGVYKSLTECQAQVGTSIFDPPASVYKGCSMPKDTEKYLSRGLKNALYSIRASDLTEDLFGTLVACPLQPNLCKGEEPNEPVTEKMPQALSADSGRSCTSCTLEFDGASKGDRQAGAGAILRSDDGTLIWRLREGLGLATCNAAEYRAFILGLRYALRKGFTNIRVQGDSKLVCMQIRGKWRVRNENLSILYEEAMILKEKFVSFQITHVLRDLNSEADAQANLGVKLAEGEIQEELD